MNGVVTPVRNPPPDTVTILDLGVSPPKVLARAAVPTSIVGPPESVAIAPDESIALVTAATKIDPADPSRTIPDDRVTVIDLKASPPAVLATLRAGNGASGVSFNPSGTLALVANRIEGTVSIFTVSGQDRDRRRQSRSRGPESGPCHVAFTRDGRTALVTRNNDSFISLLAVAGDDGDLREARSRRRPEAVQHRGLADRRRRVVGNTGAGPTGGADTISVIDLGADPPRAIGHATVGPDRRGRLDVA